ncbi:MAG: hypothetical protein H8D46_01500 [FCB group bacterium]|nr:hypothetical protein [FCB group bacterium]
MRILLKVIMPVLGSIFILFGQEYSVGDTFSIDDQQIEFDICANGEGNSTLQLIDYNYNYNGGEHFVIWLDIFAAD